jgi:hypothetical protein
MPLFHLELRTRRWPLKGAKPLSRKPSAFSGVPRHALKPKASPPPAPMNSSQRPLPAASLRGAPTTLSRKRVFSRASNAIRSWDRELAVLRHRVEELEGQNGKLIDVLKDTVSVCDQLLASARDGEAAEIQGPVAVLGSATASVLPDEKHGAGRRMKEKASGTASSTSPAKLPMRRCSPGNGTRLPTRISGPTFSVRTRTSL